MELSTSYSIVMPPTVSGLHELFLLPSPVFTTVVSFMPRLDAWSLRCVSSSMWRHKTVDIVYTIICRVFRPYQQELEQDAVAGAGGASSDTTTAMERQLSHHSSNSTTTGGGGVGVMEKCTGENMVLREIFNVPACDSTTTPVTSGESMCQLDILPGVDGHTRTFSYQAFTAVPATTPSPTRAASNTSNNNSLLLYNNRCTSTSSLTGQLTLDLEYGADRRSKIELFGRLTRPSMPDLNTPGVNHDHLRCYAPGCTTFPIIGKRFSCLYCSAIFCPKCASSHVPSHLLVVSQGHEHIDFTENVRSISVIKHPKCADCQKSGDTPIYHVIRRSTVSLAQKPQPGDDADGGEGGEGVNNQQQQPQGAVQHVVDKLLCGDCDQMTRWPPAAEGDTEEYWGPLAAAPERIYQLEADQVLRRTTFCDYCGDTVEGEYYKSLGVIDFDVCGICFRAEEELLLHPRLKHKAFLHIKTVTSFKSFRLKARITEAENEAIEFGQSMSPNQQQQQQQSPASLLPSVPLSLAATSSTATAPGPLTAATLETQQILARTAMVAAAAATGPSPLEILFDPTWDLPEHLMKTREHTKTRNPPTGRVFEAQDIMTGVQQCVKVAVPTTKSTIADKKNQKCQRREEGDENYYAEVEARLRAVQHPNLVHYKESGEMNGSELPNHQPASLRYVVGTWCAGNSVEHIMVHSAKLFLYPTAIRQFTRDMLLGLEFLHSRNLVHGNIHPKNCLQNHNGQTLLSDYQLVHQCLGHELKPDDNFNFTAPEVLVGGEVTAEGDIWALGSIIMFLMSSRRRWVEYEVKSFQGFIHYLQSMPFEDQAPNVVRRMKDYALKQAEQQRKEVVGADDGVERGAGTEMPPFVKAPYNFPREFSEMLEAIFVFPASTRPSAKDLLKHPLFDLEL